MSTESIFSMIVILTIVVGGFIYFLCRAIKKERKINRLK
jgi:preprotein translocase subunit YajC